MSPKPFVLLSVARSGTSLVIETLNTHPDILAHGEVFHEDVATHIRPEFRDRHDVTLRERDPVAFVDAVLAYAPGRRAVGFKLWHPQSPDACDHLLARTDVLKIILERKNRLAHFTSGHFARTTGIWNLRPATGPVAGISVPPMRFGPGGFRKFNAFHDAIFAHYRSRVRGPAIEMTYVQAARLEFGPLLDALGLEPRPLAAQMRRLHSPDILSRYAPEDHAAIREELTRTGRMEWLTEPV